MWFLAKNIKGLREIYHFTSKAYTQRISTKFGGRPCLKFEDVIGMSDNVYKFAGEISDEDFLKRANAIVDIGPSSMILAMKKRQMKIEKKVKVCDNAYAFEEDFETFQLMKGGQKPTPQFITLENMESDDVLEFEDYDLEKAPLLHKDGDLETLCREGIIYREENQGLKWDELYEARLRREIDLIAAKKFDSYFLIVSDMVRWAKERMLVGPSRGSCGGSLVCYLSRITEIDPIDAGLYFERFIDESRKDLPDIDIDFPGLKRQLVNDYMKEQYGNVANIGTVQRLKARSALDQVCDKLGIPPFVTFAMKAAIIKRTSGDARSDSSLQDTFETTKAGKDLLKMFPDLKRAVLIENHADHTGTHAAGLLVCNDDLQNYCTVMDDGTAQVEKKTVEDLNLLKIDVLGLRTLDIIEDSGVPVDWYKLKFDDPATYDVFNRQALSSIFQFDGQSMRNLSSQVVFKTVHDIDAVTALARPGPFGGGVTAEWLERRKGKKYEAFHPAVEAHMKDTYGLPVYQEQTMAIVREIGKFDWNQVSSIRKAVALKKGKIFFDTYFSNFLEGALTQGMTEAEAHRTWEYINSMGAYQMNKAHTYAYAVVGYWTAYLKAHFPLEFAAANLRHQKDAEAALTMLQEMVREKLPYRPFDVNKSEATWSVKDGALIAGFDSLHGFGDVKSAKFVELRNAGLLTADQIQQCNNAPSIFRNLFPMHDKWAKYYEDWKEMNLMEAPLNISDFNGEQHGSYILLGRLIQKNLRDGNEEVNVKKRNGKLWDGPVMFLDFRLADDTATIQVRIDRYKYEAIGKPIFEVPIGSILLVRAHFPKGIRFGYVQKVQILEQPEEKQPKQKRQKVEKADPKEIRIPRPKQESFRFEDDQEDQGRN